MMSSHNSSTSCSSETSLAICPIMTSKNLTTNRTLPAGRTILKRLGELSGKLEAMLPTNERGSVMDVVCTSDLGIYNVEVQVVPQDCWDIRILHHVCCLFHKFRVGMTWGGLAKDCEIGDKIKCVIGVSGFATLLPDGKLPDGVDPSLTGLTEQLVKQLAEEGEKDVKDAVADTSSEHEIQDRPFAFFSIPESTPRRTSAWQPTKPGSSETTVCLSREIL
mmetsp:Transcript_33131/g.67305  ORF Transcript_33131/g.67305 Transcript_33131/m.67305 type:complete len:220 (+) Transcript_33131:203-862(+)